MVVVGYCVLQTVLVFSVHFMDPTNEANSTG